jgi:8-oxo-dGTP pyrophosphatase MutT (NUDIX family)
MPGQMIHFGDDRRRFLFRAGAVAVIDGRVLVQQFENETFWCLPGGRVEMGEPAEEALAREMLEELACEVRVTRLLWVIDNHFKHRDVVHHELGLYFVVELPEGSPQASGEPWTGAELDGTKLYFRWQPVDRLAELDLKPSCLIERLAALPDHPEYVLHRDG